MKKIKEKSNWVVIFYDEKNNTISFNKIKGKTEVEAENEIAQMDKPIGYSGFALILDEENPFKVY